VLNGALQDVPSLAEVPPGPATSEPQSVEIVCRSGNPCVRVTTRPRYKPIWRNIRMVSSSHLPRFASASSARRPS
jgi:hypothetical protein